MTKLRAHARFGGKASENAIGGRVTGGREASPSSANGGAAFVGGYGCSARQTFCSLHIGTMGLFWAPGLSSPAVDTSKIKTSCCAAMSLVSLFFGAYPLPRLRVRPPPSLLPICFLEETFQRQERSTPRLPRRLGTKAVDGKSYEHEMFCNGSKRARKIKSPDGRRAGIKRWEGI